ncbi:MAG: EamA family transporter [Telmatospirillum sp.]|nr:EamA family transporter [Telmatospirillum sp.]
MMRTALIGVLLVLLCTILEGGAQLLLKKSSLDCGRRRLWIAAGMVMFGTEAALYTVALQFLDVSTAYPIGSLSFVVVTLLSHWLLGEQVSRTRWTGVALIIAGAGLVMARA